MMFDPFPNLTRERSKAVEAALVEAARLLTLEQFEQLSAESVHVLAGLGLLGDQQQPQEPK